jgi:hypothetical protein
MPAEEMAELLRISLPEPRHFETAARIVINELQHLPEIGETTESLGWRFEVVDIDRAGSTRSGPGEPAMKGAGFRKPSQTTDRPRQERFLHPVRSLPMSALP